MAAAEVHPGRMVYKKPMQGGQQHPNPEFYLRLVTDAYREYLKNPPSVPINQIAEVDEVFCTRTGSNEGMVERPSRGELIDTFGTANFAEIAKFMLEHGKWQPYGHHDAIRYFNEPSRIK